MIAAFKALIGQDKAVGLLDRALSRPSHAYLFVGPPGIGKFLAARVWVNALFCRTCCGHCAECRSLAHDNHPDFHVWEPKGKQNTTIEQVRDIVRQADLSPFRAPYQVHVINADTLNVASANALLKTLEEPPGGTLILLLAKNVSDLLPTLVSRCQRISFGLVPTAVIASWLVDQHQMDPVRANSVAHRSGGRPGVALTLAAADPPPATSLLGVDDLPGALVEADRLAGLPADQQIAVLEDLISQLRDVRLWLATAHEGLMGRPDVTMQLARTDRAPAYWAGAMDCLERTRRHLDAAGNARLAWSTLACDMLGLQRRTAAIKVMP